MSLRLLRHNKWMHVKPPATRVFEAMIIAAAR